MRPSTLLEPGDAFHGLHGSRLHGGVLDLDVEGTGLMVEAGRSPGSCRGRTSPS